MRKTLLLFIALITMATLTAQVPQLVNWQAVARNASGQIIPNQNMAYRFSIRDGSASGAILYSETKTLQTNQLGLATHAIGSGTVGQGNFSSINWGSGDKYLEVEMDATGGSNFTSMGAAQLLSVPYALYAGSSPDLAGDVTGAPTANTVTKIQNRNVAATAPNNNEVLKWNGTAWAPAPDAAGGGGFTLPYSNSISNASTAFDITNSCIISKDDEGHLGVRYNDFISLLTKAIQELSEKQDKANIQIQELMDDNRQLRSALQTLDNK